MHRTAPPTPAAVLVVVISLLSVTLSGFATGAELAVRVAELVNRPPFIMSVPV